MRHLFFFLPFPPPPPTFNIYSLLCLYVRVCPCSSVLQKGDAEAQSRPRLERIDTPVPSYVTHLLLKASIPKEAWCTTGVFFALSTNEFCFYSSRFSFFFLWILLFVIWIKFFSPLWSIMFSLLLLYRSDYTARLRVPYTWRPTVATIDNETPIIKGG